MNAWQDRTTSAPKNNLDQARASNLQVAENANLRSNSLRKQIQDLIAKTPGITFPEILKATHRTNGVVQHHIDVLVKWQIITLHRRGRRRHYTETKGNPQWSAWSEPLASLPRAHELLQCVTLSPGISQTAIIQRNRHPGIKRTSIQLRLARLVQLGLLISTREGRSIFYRPSPTQAAPGRQGSLAHIVPNHASLTNGHRTTALPVANNSLPTKQSTLLATDRFRE
jgi:predicted transcriptional regulator